MFQSRVITNLPTLPHDKQRLDQANTQLGALKQSILVQQPLLNETGSPQELEHDFTQILPSGSHDGRMEQLKHFLLRERKNAYYQSLLYRLHNNQPLLDEELLYFSLITDNITLISQNAFKPLLQMTTSLTTFGSHINAVYHALLLNESRDSDQRNAAHVTFIATLTHRFAFKNDVHTINLAGMTFESLSFHGLQLKNINFENSVFNQCDFYHVAFDHCLLDYAHFNRTNTLTLQQSSQLKFFDCSLQRASFVNASLSLHAKHCDFQYADFSQSSFYLSLKGCNLSKTNFDDAVLYPLEEDASPLINMCFDDACIMNDCQLSRAELNTPLNPNASYDHLTLFNAGDLFSTSPLNRKLDRFLTHTPDQLKSNYEYIHALREMIATRLLNALKSGTLNPAEKSSALTTALNHPFFKPQNPLSWACNQVTTGFGLFPQIQIIQTTAERQLLCALNELNPPKPAAGWFGSWS